MSILYRSVLRPWKQITSKLCYSTVPTTPAPTEAKVVICGGGVQGMAVAYHLAEMGWGPNTVVLEQEQLGGGTVWQTNGLLARYKPSVPESKICLYSVDLYKELSAKGYETGWKQCGSIVLARTSCRMTNLARMKSNSVCRNIDCELITPEKVLEMCPLVQVNDVRGALWIPGDGVADPVAICRAMAHEAAQKGVKIIENCKITAVSTQGGKVNSVKVASGGEIRCEYFVNCAGFWCRHVGKLSQPNVRVPLHPVEHYYLHTAPIEGGIDPNMPIVADPDAFIYLREKDGGILGGAFENKAKPAFVDGKLPASFVERQITEDWDHFHPFLKEMLHRVPILKETVLDKLCNGPEAFSPDCKWILGEVPECRNYYVAAGMKSLGISAAGGAGKATAEWIVNKHTPYDMCDLHVQRFLGLHNNHKFLRDRVREVPGLVFRIPYPFHEFKTGRNLRMSPIYPKLKEAGAVFGQVMGYERPSWFDTDFNKDMSEHARESAPYRVAYTNTYAKPPWFQWVKAEYQACREAVGLCDYSSFTKMDICSKGTEVVDALQYICSNDVDIDIGAIIHTGMQNERGGYENDCSLARVAENHYTMIAPSIQQTRCKAWIERLLPDEASVVVSDVTSMYTSICLMGPFAKKLLEELTDTDVSPSNFPFFTFKELDIGLASGIRAMNLTHTGELGFVLYIPNEFALHVYDGLVENGKKYGLKHVGYYAMRNLRIERFYAFWGQDLDSTTTPLECGRAFRVKFHKNIDFVGREALLKQKEQGVHRMYVQLLLDEHDSEVDPWPWGGEPIYRDGRHVGLVTTAGYGFTLGKQVCLGFVRNLTENRIPDVVTTQYVQSGEYEVDVGGTRYPAKINLHSPVLPTKFEDKEAFDRYQATQ